MQQSHHLPNHVAFDFFFSLLLVRLSFSACSNFMQNAKVRRVSKHGQSIDVSFAKYYVRYFHVFGCSLPTKKECTSPAHPRCCLVSNYEGTCWTANRQQEQRGEKFSTRGRVSFPGNLNHRVRGLLFTVWDYDRLPAALEFRFCYAVITTNLRFDFDSTAVRLLIKGH